MSSQHKVIKKNYETEMLINNNKLPLNHFMQETIANIMLGLTKTLKEIEPAQTLEITIKKLDKPQEVDAHTYL